MYIDVIIPRMIWANHRRCSRTESALRSIGDAIMAIFRMSHCVAIADSESTSLLTVSRCSPKCRVNTSRVFSWDQMFDIGTHCQLPPEHVFFIANHSGPRGTVNNGRDRHLIAAAVVVF